MKNWRQAVDAVQLPKNLQDFHRRIVGTLGLMFLILMALPWQQTSVGAGRVLAYSPNERPQSITALTDGRVRHWYVQEGSTVKEGDPIAEVVDNDPSFMDRLNAERKALVARLNAAKEAVKTARLNVERQKTLFDQGLSSRRAYEQSQIDLQRHLVDEANANAEVTRLEVRLSRQATQNITAPRDGVILRMISASGNEFVKAGQNLAILVPDTRFRAVETWIDGNDVPLMREGRKVRIQFEGWPAVQFSGWPSTAVGTFGGVVKVIDSSDNGKGQFRLLIVPDPEDSPWPDSKYLRQGVRAVAWVLLDQVTVGY